MWNATNEALNTNTHQVAVLRDDRPISWSEAIRAWQLDQTFRNFFIGQLSDSPFRAYFWETPPITREGADRPFEFVLIDAPQLVAARAEREDFDEHFKHTESGVAEFANLGGDAWLVAPTPQAPLSAYPHLATFSRQAPQAQQHAFWQTVGAAIERRLGHQPLWVSTAGTGVYWLHVRLDTRPKYYNHGPYRDNRA